MFLKNKYTIWYNSIIENAKSRPTKKIEGYEWHHPIPKSLGGDPKYVVQLTPKEHCVCHLLLIRMLTGEAKTKMSWALHRMLFSKNARQSRYRPSSRTYEMFRKQFYDSIRGKKRVMTDEHRANIAKANSLRKGRKDTEETKAKKRASKLGSTLSSSHKNAISKGHAGKVMTAEHRDNIRKAREGSKLSEETKKKISESGKGRKFSDETRRKLSEKAKARWANLKMNLS